MSYLGKIITLPDMSGPNYALVRDEYGTNRVVEPAEIPRGAREGDKFAYRVEFTRPTNEIALKNDSD